jgi:hypothetical protein
MNVQLGQHLKEEERPSYILGPRFQFDSILEYFTVHFYGLIGKFESVQQKLEVPTVVRLVTFQGAEHRAYYAAIEMADGLSLRPDSIIDVSFLGEDADVNTKWKGIVVNTTPFCSGYDYSAFLFRPRVGALFAPDPAFYGGEVVDASQFPTVDSLSREIMDSPGIECIIGERVSKVGITREINTLRQLYRGINSHSFPIERQIILANNFVDLPVINYFACDIAKYGQNAVD